MPELPEVETLVRSLRAPLINRVLHSVDLRWSNMLVRPAPDQLDRDIAGRRIVAIRRRGKYLIFDLIASSSGCGSALLIHLKMSGNLLFAPVGTPPSPHDRAIFEFEDRSQLRFNDPRKFGRIYLVEDADSVVGRLGPEPLDVAFDADQFERMLITRRGTIKALLLNQEFLAGVGNIYADESLWRARIHPRLPAHKLDRRQVKALFRAVRDVLNLAIRRKGTDSGDGVVPYGGYNPRVYGRDGSICYRCSAQIRRILVGQRGTHFCPQCQPLRRSSK